MLIVLILRNPHRRLRLFADPDDCSCLNQHHVSVLTMGPGEEVQLGHLLICMLVTQNR